MNIKEMMSERMRDFYEVGPVQCAAVQDYTDQVVNKVLEIMNERWYDLNDAHEVAKDTRDRTLLQGRKLEITWLKATIRRLFKELEV